MEAAEMERVIRRDPIMHDATWGVFARSELPSGPLLPGAYVLNTTDAPGEHWILIYVGDDGHVELFDSLGRTENDYGLQFNSTTLPKRLQSFNSKNCGLYVVYFLFWRSRGIDVNTLFHSLEKNGDQRVLEHYSSLCND